MPISPTPAKKTAVFVAYGGGGCANGTSCGISNGGKAVDVVACEPETAAPFAASRLKGEITQIDYREKSLLVLVT